MASDLEQLETLFVALGDRTRLRLISLMAAGPVPVGRLVDMTGESQPKVSRHLANLRNYGIVTTERVGKQVFYGLDLNGDTQAGRMFTAVISSLTGNVVEAAVQPAPEAAPGRVRRRGAEPNIYVEADVTEYAFTESEQAAEAEWAEHDDESEMDVFLL